MQITKIERASKNKPLYHLYAEDLLLMTVKEETLLHFRLQKGMDVSDAFLQEIHTFDQLQRCLEQAYRFLSRRGHFQKELQRKLKVKGYDPEIINKALQHLEDKGYLNDVQLMVQFVQDAIHLKRYGPNLIKSKLFERGLPDSAIDQALEENYPPELQRQVCQELASKKWASLKKSAKPNIRQKLVAFLQQRGFTWETIQPIVEDLTTD